MSVLKDIRAHVPDCTYHVNIGLGSIKDALDQYKVNMNPEYQRDYVWTTEQKSKFVGAALENHNAVPPFWLNWVSKDYDRSHSEIVDGKQRISAILDWIDGHIKAVCPCGIEVWHKDLNEVDLRCIKMAASFDWNFVHLPQKEVMEFYIRLNAGGTIHSEDDLNKVKEMIAKTDS